MVDQISLIRHVNGEESKLSQLNTLADTHTRGDNFSSPQINLARKLFPSRCMCFIFEIAPQYGAKKVAELVRKHMDAVVFDFYNPAALDAKFPGRKEQRAAKVRDIQTTQDLLGKVMSIRARIGSFSQIK